MAQAFVRTRFPSNPALHHVYFGTLQQSGSHWSNQLVAALCQALDDLPVVAYADVTVIAITYTLAGFHGHLLRPEIASALGFPPSNRSGIEHNQRTAAQMHAMVEELVTTVLRRPEFYGTATEVTFSHHAAAGSRVS
jgi:hypothetical protein